MIAEKMKPLMANNSAIRTMFEEGDKMRARFGAENVYDFSLGNPDAPVPHEVTEAAIDLLQTEDPVALHGYMSNAGFEDVREAIAESLNRRFGTSFDYMNILMTVGAASGLNVALKTILNPGEEVIIFAPYFLEYNWYVDNYDGRVVQAPTDKETFYPDLEAFEKLIGSRTRVVLLNSPNNPTGVIYKEETIKEIAAILERKQKELGRTIFIISDEPYRELAYGGAEVPYITKYYDNTIVAYSYSKSLSLPGERIGYLVIPPDLEESSLVFDTAANANRIIGCVNAPALQQKIIGRCVDTRVDLEYYDRNRTALYEGLKACGFDCVKPEGAFYMFLKSPVEDEAEFCNTAKKYNILMVGGSAFACPGYVRLAYCVSYETIVNSMEGFKKLAQEYGLS
ncbi:MAG TPA: pyridoxal phosphate-dependent aminotransferase [Candidatus Copromorpha excrementigallinarum]|uniref:Aminotransferase n=1 Tax=Candidatus Allocopromorpha excrementigallinarum TaxID=2840742 RepID=A0A9D1HZB8_9FIRM|nr:pyridoxal phosphate-dependent aminotransferase [Candidatus Copromorpha excrementigallinarum]